MLQRIICLCTKKTKRNKRNETKDQGYLRELRPADLEGSAGLFRLKEELLRRINLSVYPAKVEGVLFKEILVQ